MAKRKAKARAAKRPQEDDEIEERIHNDIIVDAYGPEERAMGWYNYLEDKLDFSCLLTGICISERAISPLCVGDEVELLELAPLDECGHEMFIMIRWDRRGGLGVPLSQIEPGDADEESRQAIMDWHYWMNRGYQF